MPQAPVPPRRFFGLVRRAARAEPADDPADVGTAFGMELSLAPPVWADEQRPAVAADPVRAGGWLRRWRRRRRG